MSAFTFTDPTSVLHVANGDVKTALVTITGSASYDTGGSLIDLSAYFTKVRGAQAISASTAALSKYKFTFIPGASDGAALGKLKVNDVTAASGAEVSSTTDLSAGTYRVMFYGS
jgi:hypothetical protein